MKSIAQIESAMERGEVEFRAAGYDYDKVETRVTNEEMAFLFQHYINTDTLPSKTNYHLFAHLLLQAGMIKEPSDKRKAFYADSNSFGVDSRDELNNGKLPSPESED